MKKSVGRAVFSECHLSVFCLQFDGKLTNITNEVTGTQSVVPVKLLA